MLSYSEIIVSHNEYLMLTPEQNSGTNNNLVVSGFIVRHFHHTNLRDLYMISNHHYNEKPGCIEPNRNSLNLEGIESSFRFNQVSPHQIHENY